MQNNGGTMWNLQKWGSTSTSDCAYCVQCAVVVGAEANWDEDGRHKKASEVATKWRLAKVLNRPPFNPPHEHK